jgi:hypothetical protein
MAQANVLASRQGNLQLSFLALEKRCLHNPGVFGLLACINDGLAEISLGLWFLGNKGGRTSCMALWRLCRLQSDDDTQHLIVTT